KGNSFINLTDTDDKAGAFLLATAITTGVSDAVGFREYMMDPSRGIDILSAISPSLGAKASAGKLGKNISDAITSEGNSSSTGTLALINGMKKQIGRATSELQSRFELVCRLLLEKKKKIET